MSELHPSTQAILRFFESEHVPADVQAISQPLCELAHQMVAILPSNAELTTGLRKLLEALDCFTRARLP